MILDELMTSISSCHLQSRVYILRHMNILDSIYSFTHEYSMVPERLVRLVHFMNSAAGAPSLVCCRPVLYGPARASFIDSLLSGLCFSVRYSYS